MKINPEGTVSFPLHGAHVTLDSSTLAKLWLDKVQREAGISIANETLMPSPPKIGHYWSGHGGIYVGLAAGIDDKPDYHLIVANVDRENINWKDAQAWAKGIDVDGRTDFDLPNRREQALLFANVPQLFEPRAYWSNEAHAENARDAWCQHFNHGTQYYSAQYDKLRARAVRRQSA